MIDEYIIINTAFNDASIKIINFHNQSSINLDYNAAWVSVHHILSNSINYTWYTQLFVRSLSLDLDFAD